MSQKCKLLITAAQYLTSKLFIFRFKLPVLKAAGGVVWLAVLSLDKLVSHSKKPQQETCLHQNKQHNMQAVPMIITPSHPGTAVFSTGRGPRKKACSRNNYFYFSPPGLICSAFNH